MGDVGDALKLGIVNSLADGGNADAKEYIEGMAENQDLLLEVATKRKKLSLLTEKRKLDAALAELEADKGKSPKRGEEKKTEIVSSDSDEDDLKMKGNAADDDDNDDDDGNAADDDDNADDDGNDDDDDDDNDNGDGAWSHTRKWNGEENRYEKVLGAGEFDSEKSEEYYE